MFEPSTTSQILGVCALAIGFAVAAVLVNQAEKREREEKRRQEEQDTQAVRDYNKILEMGREIERQEIRKNTRREFPGFTFDNEPPQGLRPEPLALPEPRGARYANRMG